VADYVDHLVSRPGLYTGPQADPADSAASPSVARVVVTALPGGAGVQMDYEVLSPQQGRVHLEHAVLARTSAGLVLMTSHSHAPVAAVLRETEPGYFPADDGQAPFPMAIRLEVPEPGHLVYSWSYGGQGEELRVRDVGDLRAVE
jgi:hypothetical protein